MRTARPLIAFGAVVGFVASAVVLLWSDRAGSLPLLGGRLITTTGRRTEQALGIDWVDRSDVPVAFDQLGHMVLWFIGMIIFGWVGRHRVPLRVIALLVGGASVFSEAGQAWASTTRHTNTADAIANLTGVAAATVALAIVFSVQLAAARFDQRTRLRQR